MMLGFINVKIQSEGCGGIMVSMSAGKAGDLCFDSRSGHD